MSEDYRLYDALRMNCPVEIIERMSKVLGRLKKRAEILSELAQEEGNEEYALEEKKVLDVYNREKARTALVTGFTKKGNPAMMVYNTLAEAIGQAANGTYNHPFVFDLSDTLFPDKKFIDKIPGERVVVTGKIFTIHGPRKGVYIGPENDIAAAYEFLMKAYHAAHSFNPERVFELPQKAMSFEDLLNIQAANSAGVGSRL
ncbi:hypothetical protein KY329_05100 [Candidatus Woesearchaeota archaeon]|nr:hypothetical protein [Candidatus Woesearchaeota archaeon]